ncbi:hypothetical protein Pla163_29670 [Planctomycetes bacterium Pla163]|uniref:Lipoprotein n=1 Tax=Rohdeia mirabilis TaxID=2528008 RepID=A0A518D2X6_9BACT|nr:hypothetical protein Pla163_29670 [Planctomycetes bacterium Pla163]
MRHSITTLRPLASRLHVAALCGAALVLVASCGSTPDAPDDTAVVDGVALEAPAPWTDAFVEKVYIFADVITVEGPAGLRTHCAVVQDDASYDYDLATTERGLVQTLSVKPGALQPTANVFLDNWELRGFQRVVVTERPQRDGEVIVRATGRVGAQLPEGRVEGSTFERRFVVGQ